jgi:hypothetical protein
VTEEERIVDIYDALKAGKAVDDLLNPLWTPDPRIVFDDRLSRLSANFKAVALQLRHKKKVPYDEVARFNNCWNGFVHLCDSILKGDLQDFSIITKSLEFYEEQLEKFARL